MAFDERHAGGMVALPDKLDKKVSFAHKTEALN